MAEWQSTYTLIKETHDETCTTIEKAIKCEEMEQPNQVRFHKKCLALKKIAIEGICDLCEEEMGIQHILYTCIKFTRRRLTCDCLDKQKYH
jgi:hypothetical protein